MSLKCLSRQTGQTTSRGGHRRAAQPLLRGCTSVRVWVVVRGEAACGGQAWEWLWPHSEAAVNRRQCRPRGGPCPPEDQRGQRASQAVSQQDVLVLEPRLRGACPDPRPAGLSEPLRTVTAPVRRLLRRAELTEALVTPRGAPERASPEEEALASHRAGRSFLALQRCSRGFRAGQTGLPSPRAPG